MKAIVTVVGKDQVGIIAAVAKDLAEANVSVQDISQTVMQGYFTMMMVTELTESSMDLSGLSQKLEKTGKELGISIRVQREEIFDAMHRV